MTSLPINLPDGFIPKVKKGDKVTVGEIIATQTTQDDEVINIPKELSIKKSQVKKYLKKNPGDGVSVGDVIAIRKSLFGSGVMLKSTIEGTVVRYERDSGNLIIKKSQKTTTSTIISPVDGIVSICDNSEIVIDTDKNAFVGVSGSGENAEGTITILEKDDPFYVDSSTIGKIIVGRNFTKEMLLKGIGIGVVGIIGSEIEDKDIEHLIEKKIKTPVIKIEKEDLEKIINRDTKKVFLNPELKSIIFLSL